MLSEVGHEVVNVGLKERSIAYSELFYSCEHKGRGTEAHGAPVSTYIYERIEEIIHLLNKRNMTFVLDKIGR